MRSAGSFSGSGGDRESVTLALDAHQSGGKRQCDTLDRFMVHKRRAEEALEASRLIYTIVRPGGMERPQDDYKVTHNVALSPRDTRFGGQVSRLQVAELIATAVANTDLAENKVSSLCCSNILLMRWNICSACVDFHARARCLLFLARF